MKKRVLIVGIVLLFVGAGMTPIIIGEDCTLSKDCMQGLVYPLRTHVPTDIHRDLDTGLMNEDRVLSRETVFSFYDDSSWEWVVRAGGTNVDIGNCVAVDANGNSIITGVFKETASFGGTTLTSAGGYDVFVAKLDTNGNWLWAKSAGGSGDDEGQGVAVDTNGNVYITGQFRHSASFGSTILTSAGVADVFVAKLNSNGVWQWAVSAGGTSEDIGYGVAVDTNGNAYVTGHFEGSASFGGTTLTSTGNYDVFVAKLDTNGNWQWAKSAGGTNWDVGYGVAVDTNGNAIITGSFMESASFGGTTLTSTGNWDVFVAKLNSNGAWLWAKSAGGSDWDEGQGVAVDTSGNAYVTGYFQGSASFGGTTLVSQGSADVFVAKLNSNGVWQWAVSAGGTSEDIGYGVAVDTNGNAYVTGHFEGSASFGGTTLTSTGNYDVFVAKLDTNGNWQWAKSAGGTNWDGGMGVAVDVNGNVIITGYFQGSASFGGTTLVSQGGSDVFVAKLSDSGSGLTFNITGGLGVNLKITNSGTTRATVTDWHIQVEGGIFGKINEMINGTVDISAGETKTVGTGLFFGIGSISIVAKVADEEKTTAGTHLFIFSIVK